MEEKTIVGIASAAGGGIGIIRVSGSESMKIIPFRESSHCWKI